MADMRKVVLVVSILVIFGVVLTWRAARNGTPIPTALPSGVPLPFNLPEGFAMEVFVENLINPRVIAFDPRGRMLVSETSAGRVMIVAPERRVVLEGLDQPHGLAFFENYLYVATVREVARYRYDAETASADLPSKKNIVAIPPGGRHFTRTIGFGPNLRADPIIGGYDPKRFLAPQKLYVGVGSSCDVCLESSWKYAAILESDPAGTFTAEVAGGLRNSVFFTFHPTTGEIWATEMGRDGLGDNLPPDEINIIGVNKKYGWPYCYGNRVQDTTFAEKTSRTDLPMDCSKTEPPVLELPAHVAPLGIAFIPNSWPAPWRGRLLVAYHGSTERSAPVGYQIIWFDAATDGKVRDAGVFLDGFLQGKNLYGRPVDLKFDGQGNLFISDDSAGVIYKVSPAS